MPITLTLSEDQVDCLVHALDVYGDGLCDLSAEESLERLGGPENMGPDYPLDGDPRQVAEAWARHEQRTVELLAVLLRP